MKVNNINVTKEEAANLSHAINYAITLHGKMVFEEDVYCMSHTRDINVMVYVDDGWSKCFNLTTGAVTNLEATEDTDGNPYQSIVTRIEKLMDRVQGINSRIAELEKIVDRMQEINSRFAELNSLLWS